MKGGFQVKLGIIGCGDFLRWQSGALKSSTRMSVAKVFDPDAARAASWADRLGATTAASAEAIIADPSIDGAAAPRAFRTAPPIVAVIALAGQRDRLIRPRPRTIRPRRALRLALASLIAPPRLDPGRWGNRGGILVTGSVLMDDIPPRSYGPLIETTLRVITWNVWGFARPLARA